MGGSDGDVVPFHHTPPSRGGRGRGTGNHKRPTVVHSGIQETIDEDDRSASLTEIQEAHRIMMMNHCRQSWEDSERTIGFGLPLKAITETPNRNTGLNKQTGIGPGTPFVAPAAVRQLDMETLDRKPQTVEERDPEPHRREAKKVEPHNSCNQTPARDRKAGGTKDKQNTCTITTDTRHGASKQVGHNRGKPTKSTDPQSTSSLLDIEAHKDTTRPTQPRHRTHPQFPDGPTQ